MKDLKIIDQEFDEKFGGEPNWLGADRIVVKDFIHLQIQQAREEVLRECLPEIRRFTGKGATNSVESVFGWNCCRKEMQRKIKQNALKLGIKN